MDNKILVGSVMVTAVAIMTACTGRGTGKYPSSSFSCLIRLMPPWRS